MSGLVLLAWGLCLGKTVADTEPATLYAADLIEPLSESDAMCMKMSQYSTVFLRAYADGFRSESCKSILNAKKAGLGVEVFMTPTRPSYTSGSDQFLQLYKGLKACEINVASVWLQVMHPMDWMFQLQASINFINDVIERAGIYGVSIGIYTNQKDWMEITNGVRELIAPTSLWYWNISQPGPLGETAANFTDFTAFGPWTSPAVKQFGQFLTVCGLTVNSNIYIPSKNLHENDLRYTNHSEVGSIALQ